MNKQELSSAILERMKVRAICNDLGINDRRAKLYVQIHGFTEGGQKGLEVFETADDQELGLELLDQLTSLDCETTMAAFIQAELKEEVKDVKRLFSDPDFRVQVYNEYMKIVPPNMHKYNSFMDVLKAARRNARR